MMLLLLLGLMFLAAAAFVGARAAFAPTDERRASLDVARSYGEEVRAGADASSRSLFQGIRERVIAMGLRFASAGSRDDIEKRLAAAGLNRRLTPEAFLGIRFVGVVGGVLFALTVGGLRPRGFLLAIVFGYAALKMPTFLLARRAASRADQIAGNLPNFVDRLAISMEAGLSFDAALTHVVDKMTGPLADELRIVLAEVRVGESRRGALQSFAERIDAPEVAAFSGSILQAEQLGMSVSGILREQANDIRNRRHLAAEEKAMKAPVKMLFPIVIFILPVMFVVILAPPIIEAVKNF